MIKEITMLGSGLLAMVAIVGAVWGAVDWHVELKDQQERSDAELRVQQEELIEVVGQLQQSRELDIIWQLDQKWASYGLTRNEHQKWCFLRKKHSLPPCPNRLKK
jgi:hypothetical protein